MSWKAEKIPVYAVRPHFSQEMEDYIIAAPSLRTTDLNM
jgi:hypothetical protein